MIVNCCIPVGILFSCLFFATFSRLALFWDSSLAYHVCVFFTCATRRHWRVAWSLFRRRDQLFRRSDQLFRRGDQLFVAATHQASALGSNLGILFWFDSQNCVPGCDSSRKFILGFDCSENYVLGFDSQIFDSCIGFSKCIPALDSWNVFLYLILGILFLGLGNRWNDRRRVLVAWKERLYLGQMLDGVVRSSVSFFLRASDVDILLHFSEALKCGYFVAFVSEALKSWNFIAFCRGPKMLIIFVAFFRGPKMVIFSSFLRNRSDRVDILSWFQPLN